MSAAKASVEVGFDAGLARVGDVEWYGRERGEDGADGRAAGSVEVTTSGEEEDGEMSGGASSSSIIANHGVRRRRVVNMKRGGNRERGGGGWRVQGRW